MDLMLEGRVFVVTGGSSGLGFATAEALVAEGARVLLSARDAARLEAAVARLGGESAGVVGCTADVTLSRAPARLITAALNTFDQLDGAFISHGGPPAGPAAALSDRDLERATALAMTGPIRMMRDIVATLGPGGSVVVLTSSTSIQPIANLATSNLARPAVWGYAHTLAAEVAPRGVRVNVLLPGRYATERVAELESAASARDGRSLEQVRADAEASIPLRRLGRPEELGRVAAFLLSPAASYVTGSAWRADGGTVRGL